MANSTNTQRPDLEDLVAFLEGRGSEAMRALVLQRLDEDPAYLATMNDLVPMFRDAGLIPEGGIALAPSGATAPAEEKAPANVIGDPARFRRRTGLIAIAATLASIGIGLWLFTGSGVRHPLRLAQLLAASSKAPPVVESWSDINRGVGNSEQNALDTTDHLSTADLRLAGAQILDLEMATKARNHELAWNRLELLKSTLSGKADSTYDGVPLTKDGPADWVKVEKEMAAAYEWLGKPEVSTQDELNEIERGVCLRAAWLAQQAGNPGFTNSWTATCREALRGQDLNAEIEKMRSQFDPLMDDLQTDEDGAAAAPPG